MEAVCHLLGVVFDLGHFCIHLPDPNADNRLAIFGPVATKWFGFLQRKINLSNPNATILARVAADQTIFASCNLAFFLSSMAVMEGSDPKQKLEKSYWSGLKANWTLWPAVQAINFKFVPLHHRVLVVNIISIGEYH